MRFRIIALLLLALGSAEGFAIEPGHPIISNVARVLVESSALASVGYSKYLQVLEVEFHNGAVYRYADVPESVFREMLKAPSKAGYYNEHIRGHYRSVHVKPAE